MYVIDFIRPCDFLLGGVSFRI